MALLRIVVDTNDATAASLTSRLGLNTGGHGGEDVGKIASYMMGVAGGAFTGAKVWVNSGGVAATSTFTFTGQPTAAQTCLINGVTFTARASGAVANEFNTSATVAISAANFAAMVNASVSAKIKGVVTATSALGVVTLTAVIPGAAGNLNTQATSMSNTSVSGAAMTGGTDGTAYVYSVGK